MCALLRCGGWLPLLEESSRHETKSNHSDTVTCSLQMDEKMPYIATVTMPQLERLCEPLLQESEEIGSWPKVLQSLLVKDNFVEDTLKILKLIQMKQQQPCIQMIRMNSVIEKFCLLASVNVNLIPGNLRNILQSFSPVKQFNESTKEMFTSRQSYDAVKHYLKHLMAFLLVESGCPIMSHYLPIIDSSTFNEEEAVSVGFLPSLIYDLASESQRIGVPSWLLRHAQILCMQIDKNGHLKLNRSDYSSQKMATCLHAIRVAVCFKLVLHNSTGTKVDKILLEMVESIQNKTTINIICPWIRMLRDDAKKRPDHRSILVDEHENIIVDSVLFEREKYEKLVKLIYTHIHTQFELFFSGEHIMNFKVMVAWQNIQ